RAHAHGQGLVLTSSPPGTRTLRLMEVTMIFLDCPAYLDDERTVRCGRPAEVSCRFTMRSTGGPLESAMIRCPAGHWFNGPIQSPPREKPPTARPGRAPGARRPPPNAPPGHPRGRRGGRRVPPPAPRRAGGGGPPPDGRPRLLSGRPRRHIHHRHAPPPEAH